MTNVTSKICTAPNSEYPATLRFAQIGSRWSPTSGTAHNIKCNARRSYSVEPSVVRREKRRRNKISVVDKYAVLYTHEKTDE